MVPNSIKWEDTLTLRLMSFFFLRAKNKVWHMEVPRLGIESELQLLAYATTIAMWDPSHSVTYTTDNSNAGSLTH